MRNTSGAYRARSGLPPGLLMPSTLTGPLPPPGIMVEVNGLLWNSEDSSLTWTSTSAVNTEEVGVLAQAVVAAPGPATTAAAAGPAGGIGLGPAAGRSAGLAAGL